LGSPLKASVGRNNQRALRHVHMTCKHNLYVGFFWVSCAVHGFYFSCRNALGLIATYATRTHTNIRWAANGRGSDRAGSITSCPCCQDTANGPFQLMLFMVH
jgi:hypothetical protein